VSTFLSHTKISKSSREQLHMFVSVAVKLATAPLCPLPVASNSLVCNYRKIIINEMFEGWGVGDGCGWEGALVFQT